MLVTSLAVVKSYILAGDVHQGLTFLRCSDKATKLEELSRVRHPVLQDDITRHLPAVSMHPLSMFQCLHSDARAFAPRSESDLCGIFLVASPCLGCRQHQLLDTQALCTCRTLGRLTCALRTS